MTSSFEHASIEINHIKEPFNRHGAIRPYTVPLFKAHRYLYIFDYTKQNRKCVTINKYKYQKCAMISSIINCFGVIKSDELSDSYGRSKCVH